MKNFFVRHLLYVWSVFILVLTLFPMKDNKGTVETYYDKVAHFFLFGIFSFLFFRLFSKKISKIKLFMLSLFSGAVFSLTIEFFQVYVPGRTASELDLLAGVSGSVFFAFMAIIFLKTKINE